MRIPSSLEGNIGSNPVTVTIGVSMTTEKFVVKCVKCFIGIAVIGIMSVIALSLISINKAAKIYYEV